ncbi:MAG: response regulator [Pseudanabaenaceae cyanobacterium SKYGB_i_bin29]|nr:response regulator [Pseudanabaenaceae cyanobacterium SKYG29]MDW8422483.1 response regulator [Pseudanabaenaceae cyanobacterium SKYGB_i_bin29]
MKILTIDELQAAGAAVLGDGKLSFQGQTFLEGGTFPGTSQAFVLSMAEKYRNLGIECLVVETGGKLTLWRAEKKTGIALQNNFVPKMTIAHIDDSPSEGKILEHLLEGCNCQLVQISNAMVAVTTLLKVKPDLIFLDLHMPIVNGYEICAQLRRVEAFQHTPIIILTGNDGLIDRVRAKMVGATDFISKPIDRVKIMGIINKYRLPQSA